MLAIVAERISRRDSTACRRVLVSSRRSRIYLVRRSATRSYRAVELRRDPLFVFICEAHNLGSMTSFPRLRVVAMTTSVALA